MARALISLSALLLGRERRSWARAMRAELDSSDPQTALAWSWGCMIGALSVATRHWLVRIAPAAFLASALAILVDWHAPRAALPLLLATAAVYGFWRGKDAASLACTTAVLLAAAHIAAAGGILLRPHCAMSARDWYIIMVAPAFAFVVGGVGERVGQRKLHLRR